MNKIFVTLIFTISSLFNISCSNISEKKLENDFPIIPTPQEINYGAKEVSFSNITINKTDFSTETDKLISFFNEKGIKQTSNGLKFNFIKEQVSDNEEAYSIEINSSITIKATTEKGAFYAIQTLKQLFRQKENQAIFPYVNITDWPAFKIRGFMHDTGRNFQSVAQLKEQIEVLAQYKYNVFHWHLTDNPGWRLESKKYPELQSPEATTRAKGKFYTQEDFKDILAFCKERHITVIPELDIPGHTEAFRKAFNIKNMRDKKVLPILLDLFDELCALAGPEEMPYIHIGTDEVKGKLEAVSNDFILTIMNRLKKHNREIIVWKQGIVVPEDHTSINQLWAQHKGRKGHRFIDSRANYINHLDPFAGMARLYFQQPCRQPKGDSLALGGILCAWPDNYAGDERNVIKQNPIYPSMVFYADAIWKGREKDYPEYWAKLPKLGSKEFDNFKTFEEKVITHRNLFFEGKEFQYVKQTEVQWSIIGPFNHKGNVSKSFQVENEILKEYTINGKKETWQNDVMGATIHLKHFFGFPSYTSKKSGTYYAYTKIYSPDDRVQDFWVGFQGWSRSSRRGGPTPSQGQWHTTNPKIWVNNTEIAPPVWQQPNLGPDTHEIPFVDEDYFYRAPTKIQLKKGWNTFLLKIPQGGNSWKWMFTCVPVNIESGDVKEQSELKFKSDFN